MKLIKQRSDNDCGVACAAMITGSTYEEAYECFSPNFGESGAAHTHSIDKFLKKHGLTIYVRDMKPKSKTVAYLYNCASPAGSHFVVMDVKGEFYDPSPTPLEEYHRCNIYEVRPYAN